MSPSSSAVSTAIRELDELISTETVRARHISLVRIRAALADSIRSLEELDGLDGDE